MEQTPEYFTLYLSDVLNEKNYYSVVLCGENQGSNSVFEAPNSKEGLTCVFMRWYGSNSASFFPLLFWAAKHFNLKKQNTSFLDVGWCVFCSLQLGHRWSGGVLEVRALLSGVSRPLPLVPLNPHFLSSNYNHLPSCPSNPFTQHQFCRLPGICYSGRSSW